MAYNASVISVKQVANDRISQYDIVNIDQNTDEINPIQSHSRKTIYCRRAK